MIAIGLAAVTALGWGVSDYFGGDSSGHETPVFVVLAVVEGIGLLLLVPVLLARGVAPPISPQLLLAALAGVAVTVELGVVYAALGRGDTFIGAPTGAIGAAIAVVAGLIGGDPLGLMLTLGLICALLGGGLSAWAKPAGKARPGWRAFASVLLASAAVGTMLVSLNGAGRLDAYWAIAVERLSTIGSALVLVGVRRHGRRPVHLPRREEWPRLGLVGALGLAGDLAYAAAARHGSLSIISAISSLYPIPTIALGQLLGGKRTSVPQLAGATLALSGAVLLGATGG
jgi:drug/metabolite transporter (DMT)-like permease